MEVDELDSKGGSGALRNGLEDGCGTPYDALEERLASIWEEVVGMSAVSMDDGWPFVQNVLSFASQIANEGVFYGSWVKGAWATS